MLHTPCIHHKSVGTSGSHTSNLEEGAATASLSQAQPPQPCLVPTAPFGCPSCSSNKPPSLPPPEPGPCTHCSVHLGSFSLPSLPSGLSPMLQIIVKSYLFWQPPLARWPLLGAVPVHSLYRLLLGTTASIDLSGISGKAVIAQ